MADNYLERHYEEYLKRKAAWEKTNRKCYARPIVKKSEGDESEDN